MTTNHPSNFPPTLRVEPHLFVDPHPYLLGAGWTWDPRPPQNVIPPNRRMARDPHSPPAMGFSSPLGLLNPHPPPKSSVGWTLTHLLPHPPTYLLPLHSGVSSHYQTNEQQIHQPGRQTLIETGPLAPMIRMSVCYTRSPSPHLFPILAMIARLLPPFTTTSACAPSIPRRQTKVDDQQKAIKEAIECISGQEGEKERESHTNEWSVEKGHLRRARDEWELKTKMIKDGIHVRAELCSTTIQQREGHPPITGSAKPNMQGSTTPSSPLGPSSDPMWPRSVADRHPEEPARSPHLQLTPISSRMKNPNQSRTRVPQLRAHDCVLIFRGPPRQWTSQVTRRPTYVDIRSRRVHPSPHTWTASPPTSDPAPLSSNNGPSPIRSDQGGGRIATDLLTEEPSSPGLPHLQPTPALMRTKDSNGTTDRTRESSSTIQGR